MTGLSLGALDFTRIIAVLGLILSIASLSLGLFNAYIAWQNRKLALKQDARKVTKLTCYLNRGFQKTDDTGSAFSLLVQVRNPSESNNAIASAELIVRYRTKDRLLMRLKLPLQPHDTVSFLRSQAKTLSPPVKVPAHEVVSGWLHFKAPIGLLSGMAIDGYELEITDTHDAKTTITPNLMQEYQDEAGLA